MLKFIPKKNIVRWIAAATAATVAVFLFFRQVPFLSGFFSGCLSVLVNFFIIYSDVAKMGDGTKPFAIASFWKTFPVRLLVMIALFYIFLVVLKVSILAFLAGVIATFIFLVLRVGSFLLRGQNDPGSRSAADKTSGTS